MYAVICSCTVLSGGVAGSLLSGKAFPQKLWGQGLAQQLLVQHCICQLCGAHVNVIWENMAGAEPWRDL